MRTLTASKTWPARRLHAARRRRAAATRIVHAELPRSVEWPNTVFERRLLNLDEIQSSGPPLDGIPPVDDPALFSVEEAGEWLDPGNPVTVVAVGGEVKAYPLQIMTWHETVNDAVGSLPAPATFCPLGNTSIVFDRRTNGEVFDFVTTRMRREEPVVDGAVDDTPPAVVGRRGMRSVHDAGVIAGSPEAPSTTPVGRRPDGRTRSIETHDESIVDLGTRRGLPGTALEGPRTVGRPAPAHAGSRFAFARLGPGSCAESRAPWPGPRVIGRG